ncbi:translation initiation factor IF-2 [Candidatus Palibaumannia cicadellinicola]|uniref:Translation initiation factor IF-2 n=2 Tax=cellular organisms TaxID=131567 RepID=IF2_BAUCH|nr:translation initiation factor IF-2 [Candidatus Baumannia cicadellinicola]Q1LSK8.1 RecName: Full=Translation initiation factor IF-2 [Baumannia cicadellinicola str. Hc (Homalodisca coagulata)]ABF14122.1 translation initiation factor IF2-2 [Baumannia cicadellinicola str. Hc (Homalodisca coagulata)]MBS0032509.1 translation initiation factor IF-2 [Candidatus Baumannia cicadellinicola]MCJ7461971.1 translation initiation factor IF-2 [Candidatus Baumannia cicadellinicola]
MKNVTVKSLAVEMQISVDHLVQQFSNVGFHKTARDYVTQQEKETLLAYLKYELSNTPLTLQRKTRSTLNIASTSGRSKSVQVEVRKKHIYIQPVAHDSILTIKENILPNNTQEVKNNAEASPKTKFILTPKQQSKIAKNNIVNNQNNLIKKSRQISEKAILEAKAAELKHQAEEETRRKVEEKARQIAEEARQFAEHNDSIWMTTPELAEDDTIDDNLSNYHYASIVEDENNRKIENERRTRGNKVSKQKTYRLSEFKKNREEARAVGRSSKSQSKRKSSTLMQVFNKPSQVINRDIVIGEMITVAELANKMAVKGSQIIKKLIQLGVMATINQIIDRETAQLVAEDMGHKVILLRENELEESIMKDRKIDSSVDNAESRAPVVTIMGHVDHGKTSLLDYIRSTKVVASEAGGITQHIGAYHVETDRGMITFLDTPGHAAFTAMRARGARTTDIVVLVVAADNGAMPQTIEAIQHAKAAKVPIVVAVNKIDKKEANPENIKNELTKHGIIPEEWGGQNQFVNISAKYGTGINNLLDAILLQAEVLELKAIRNGIASGIVIESFLDKGRGPVATILVREGTLHHGDMILCGLEYGRVRAMRDEQGRHLSTAGPSVPVEILGLSGVPIAGDEAMVVRDEKKAREVALYRQGKFREGKLARKHSAKLENMFTNISEGGILELNIILKTDVQGSVEAINDALEQLSTEKAKVKIIGSGVGGITETDATLAAASNAILIGFNVRADASARRIIDKENLNIHYYSVIYHLINEVTQAMNGMLTPEYKQDIIGLAEVRNVFSVPKFGLIAGCMVIEGIVKRHNNIRVIRNNIIIYEGELYSLRRFKDDVNEVRNGMECGIGVKNYTDIRTGDIIEVFKLIPIIKSSN